jgi:hypothetical protein
MNRLEIPIYFTGLLLSAMVVAVAVLRLQPGQFSLVAWDAGIFGLVFLGGVIGSIVRAART